MNDFETMIREALKSGKTHTQIASEVSHLLNTIPAEKTPEQELLESWEDMFHDSYESGEIHLHDAVALVTLVVADEHPDWDVDTIKKFMEVTEESIKLNARFMTENPLKVIGDAFEDAFGELEAKAREKRHECSCGKAPHPMSDEDAIANFLKSLK